MSHQERAEKEKEKERASGQPFSGREETEERGEESVQTARG